MVLKEVRARRNADYGFKNKPAYKRVRWEGKTKDGRKKPVYAIEIGKCPCAVCNHTTMEECEKGGCNCCSEFCT